MFCQQCGQEIPDRAVVCVHCGVATGGGSYAKSRLGYVLFGLFLGALASIISMQDIRDAPLLNY